MKHVRREKANTINRKSWDDNRCKCLPNQRIQGTKRNTLIALLTARVFQLKVTNIDSQTLKMRAYWNLTARALCADYNLEWC